MLLLCRICVVMTVTYCLILGECWAARRKIDRIQVFTSHMMNRNKCVKEWYQTCGVHSKRCVGKDHGFAVYELDPYVSVHCPYVSVHCPLGQRNLTL